MNPSPSRRFPPPPWCRWAAAALALALPSAAAETGVPDPRRFPVPAQLETNVDFWTRVYSVHDNDKALLHDELHLEVVYEVLDFSDIEAGDGSDVQKGLARQRRVRETVTRYRTLLDHLAAGRAPEADAGELGRLERLLAAVPGDAGKYRAAKARLRTQTCLKNRFAEAVERSGAYLPAMEETFTRHGLPVELTRLPFVESLFQWNARSSARAGGIWQFMPSTARLYLKMELEYDERFAPLKATDAAARLLAANYRSLETWPLAITAYNHGAGGMRRAVRSLGTRDLGEIATRYRSRSFGFASRNFYAEFIAAARVYADREVHFPNTSPRPPLAYDEFVPGLYVALGDLAREAGADLGTLREMNPALAPEVWAGHLFLPEDYSLLVPAGREPDFRRAVDALPDNRKSRHQVGVRYRVRRGDTLGRIAERFGSSVRTLQRANKLTSPHRIRVGQLILIPPEGRTPRGGSPARAAASAAAPATAVASATAVAPATATAEGPTHHVVRHGETLWRIARLYGTTVTALKSLNGLKNNIIRPRQRLIVR